jgi:hypothetical protein
MDSENSQKKKEKNSVRIASVLAKIQIILNSSLEPYHYINLLNHFIAN